MQNPNYNRSILVSNSPSSAFSALTENIGSWWTQPDKPMTRVGDRAKFSFPPGQSFWTFEAMLLEQDKRVEMQCVEALHIHEGQPKEIEQEWLGTKVIWRIEAEDDATRIHVEHMGLVPTLLCYEICEAGWDMFFVDSLKAYLNTGVGQPHSASA